MKYKLRSYQTEQDYWKIREFLRRVFILNDLREKSWHVARWDYWYYHGVKNKIFNGSLYDSVFIWENHEKEIVSVLNPERARGEAILQIDPRVKSIELVEEMVSTAEKHLVHKSSNGDDKVTFWVDGNDITFQNILLEKGYTRKGVPEHQHRVILNTQTKSTPANSRYNIRSLGDIDELPARSWLSWKVFHPNDPDDLYEGWEWYLNLQKIPLYRRDLDLVTVSYDGELVSFCTFWYDDVTRTAYVEPVGTHPEHQKRGLGRAIISEGMHRVKKLGGIIVYIGGYSDAANSLYSWFSDGQKDLSEPWQK